jgi:hypothetical protein
MSESFDSKQTDPDDVSLWDSFQKCRTADKSDQFADEQSDLAERNENDNTET